MQFISYGFGQPQEVKFSKLTPTQMVKDYNFGHEKVRGAGVTMTEMLMDGVYDAIKLKENGFTEDAAFSNFCQTVNDCAGAADVCWSPRLSTPLDPTDEKSGGECKASDGATYKCSGNNHCKAGVSTCLNNTCLFKDGANCTAATECASGVCLKNKCGLLKDGATCTAATECASGACLKNTCAVPLKGGETCAAATECASGACVDNTCLSKHGETCTAMMQCTSQICLSDCPSGSCGETQPKTERVCVEEIPCKEASNCASGVCVFPQKGYVNTDGSSPPRERAAPTRAGSLPARPEYRHRATRPRKLPV